jgi:hypothetical protein
MFNSVTNALGGLVVGTPVAGTGWPGLLTVQTTSKPVDIALHVSSISSHARKDYEMRFQNPASDSRPPVSDNGGQAFPILLGLDDEDAPKVFVAVDGRSRIGNTTRFSLLFHKRIISEAKSKGWAVYQSQKGEKFYCFVPSLFPAFIDQITHGEMVLPELISAAAIASGVLDTSGDTATNLQAAKRASKAVTVLVRKAGFGKKVRNAYAHKCAMCGLGSNLLEGAHIYPVEAAGSTDNIWNGLALCHNHHGAFDRHLVWIDPETYKIRLHPSLHLEAETNPGTKHFLDSTQTHLSLPALATSRPRLAMFLERYAYFEELYSWTAKKTKNKSATAT